MAASPTSPLRERPAFAPPPGVAPPALLEGGEGPDPEEEDREEEDEDEDDDAASAVTMSMLLAPPPPAGGGGRGKRATAAAVAAAAAAAAGEANTERRKRAPPNPERKSSFRGVSWQRMSRAWVSQFKSAGKTTYLGIFRTEEEAAKAYDVATFLKGGKKLNFGEPTQEELEEFKLTGVPRGRLGGSGTNKKRQKRDDVVHPFSLADPAPDFVDAASASAPPAAGGGEGQENSAPYKNASSSSSAAATAGVSAKRRGPRSASSSSAARSAALAAAAAGASTTTVGQVAAEFAQSDYLGVEYDMLIKEWRAMFQGAVVGLFKTEEDAAHAYNAAAIRHAQSLGPDAPPPRLNHVGEGFTFIPPLVTSKSSDVAAASSSTSNVEVKKPRKTSSAGTMSSSSVSFAPPPMARVTAARPPAALSHRHQLSPAASPAAAATSSSYGGARPFLSTLEDAVALAERQMAASSFDFVPTPMRATPEPGQSSRRNPPTTGGMMDLPDLDFKSDLFQSAYKSTDFASSPIPMSSSRWGSLPTPNVGGGGGGGGIVSAGGAGGPSSAGVSVPHPFASPLFLGTFSPVLTPMTGVSAAAAAYTSRKSLKFPEALPSVAAAAAAAAAVPTTVGAPVVVSVQTSL